MEEKSPVIAWALGIISVISSAVITYLVSSEENKLINILIVSLIAMTISNLILYFFMVKNYYKSKYETEYLNDKTEILNNQLKDIEKEHENIQEVHALIQSTDQKIMKMIEEQKQNEI